MIKHFRNDCVESSFAIEILEVLEGDGNVNGIASLIAKENRLGWEDYWMKTLRTKCPYSLNDRTRGEETNKSVGLRIP